MQKISIEVCQKKKKEVKREYQRNGHRNMTKMKKQAKGVTKK